jgi:hypothetical protein
MRNDSLGNDPRAIWQDQPTEASVLTLEKIKQKVRELHAETHRQLLGSLIVPIIAVAFYGVGMTQLRDPTLQPLYAFVIAWSLAGLYFLNRGMWTRAMPGDAALDTGLEFYRREVERRRTYFRRVVLWSFGPVVMALAALILSAVKVGILTRGTFPNAAPFLTLVVVWIAAYGTLRIRGQRKLRREIDELNDIERQKSE